MLAPTAEIDQIYLIGQSYQQGGIFLDKDRNLGELFTTGAQWNVESVNQILSERLRLSQWFTCYLSFSAKTGCSHLPQVRCINLCSF